MKVTVCFGDVRVLVPCGDGDLLVRDLVREAILRYKKASGKGPESWVVVKNIRSNTGGILDPDDRLRDVADDRETLTADCPGLTAAPPAVPRQHAGGDGASGSSVGTASPDMFRGGGSMREVEVEACSNAAGLQVRRGSEPTLHQDQPSCPPQISDPSKRWSAAVVCRDEPRITTTTQKSPPHIVLPDGHRTTDQHPSLDSNRLNGSGGSANFQRQTNRLSMQFSGQGSGVWLDAAERVQSLGTKSLPRDTRKEPVGQDVSTMDNHNINRVEDIGRWVSGVNNNVQERPLDRIPKITVNGHTEKAKSIEVPVSVNGLSSSSNVGTATQTLNVSLVKRDKGLGFTITTRDNPTGGLCPIYIKNILLEGAAETDGRLRAGDRLVSVNGNQVSGMSQEQVVKLLRNTKIDSTVTLVVERNATNGPRTQRVEPQQSPTKYTEKAIGTPTSIQTNKDIQLNAKSPVENGRVNALVNAFNQGSSIRENKKNKSLRDEDLRDGNVSLDDDIHTALDSINSVLGTRRRLILRLDVPVHSSDAAGLGVSVKGKVTLGVKPQDLGIFVKSVLHGGAASRDGRLHTNDQLLSVNGVSLMGQSNAEAMETLRKALLYSRGNIQGNISLTIARRTESMDSLAMWKDDTPPTDSSNENTNTSFPNNTVIYNNKSHRSDSDLLANHVNVTYDVIKANTSVVNINNNTWNSNHSDDSKGYLERDKEMKTPESKRDSFEWSRLEGWNPVIDRLTGGRRNESYYMATQDTPLSNGVKESCMRTSSGGYNNIMQYNHRSPPAHHNVIIEEEYGTTKATSSNGTAYESGSEASAAAGTQFSRDAIGRRSMSEKRHAAVNAATTATYRRIKEQKAINAQQVGPALGMRKSSSLESLQTAVHEASRREPLYSRPHRTPMKHWLTDEGNDPANTMIRGSPQQSSLSHKKTGVLKSISNMFKFGKPHKKQEEVYSRTQPTRSSEKSLPHISHHRTASGNRTNSHVPPYRSPPSHAYPQVMEGAWNGSHYVNYDEIQQNLTARREKLSEVQIGQMRRQVQAQRVKAEEESSRRAGTGYHSQRSSKSTRPQSYYETARVSHYH